MIRDINTTTERTLVVIESLVQWNASGMGLSNARTGSCLMDPSLWMALFASSVSLI